MPAPEPDFIVPPTVSPVSVALEPAQNAIHSLLLLAKVQHCSGLSNWVTRTANALTPTEHRENKLVLIGFHYAVLPEQGWPSFPVYVDHLATCDPNALRDKMLAAYARFPPMIDGEKQALYDEPRPVDLEAVLKDVDSYLDFLRARFGADHMDDELEAWAYSYVLDPPAMQEFIVSQLRKMWNEHLAAEWQRVEPMLRDAVQALRQIDFSAMNVLEAAQSITGRELEEKKWEEALERAEQVIFVPTAHIGPYLGRLGIGGDTLWVFFRARPSGEIQPQAPDLSLAEIVVRLSALADDTRLRILKLIVEEGELLSQDIMTRLDLSQSAASRHLKQLSAVGYLTARRHDGAKCFALSPQHIEDTLRAVSSFLLGK